MLQLPASPFSLLRLSLFILGIMAFGSNTAAQTTPDFPPLKIGEWRQHLPWQRVRSATQSDSKIYFATEWALVEMEKSDRSPRFITKVEGLSDIGMSLVRFNRAANVLVMAYTNSNLDLWRPTDGSVINMPFIKKNVNIAGDKKIYDIAFQDKNAYLACGFGILKINLEREEVEYTVFTDMPVRSFAVYDDYLYAGGDEGVFRISANDPNPADFGRWQMLGAAQGFPAGQSVNAMVVKNSQLYLGIEKTLYRYDGNALQIVTQDDNQSVIYLSAEGEGVLVGWKKDFSGRVLYLASDGGSANIQVPCDAIRPIYAIEDGSKKFWFADDDDDFRFYDLDKNQCDRFRFNSPYNHFTSEIAIAHDKVYVTTPGQTPDQKPLYGPWGIYIYENEEWKRFNVQTNPELDDGDCERDLWRIALDPNVPEKFYAGSYVGGLVEVTDGGAKTKCYNRNNSILQSPPTEGRTAISGLAYDADGNVWMSNYSAGAPIAVMKADGTLRNFSAAPVNNLFQVVVDQNGYKWFVVGFNGGVLVYDSGQDIDSPADDRYRVLTSGNSVLPTNTVNCIAVDLEGDVWIGTQQGVVSFECGSNVFDASVCKGSRRIVNVDGFNGYLLENEDIRSIAIDGANRKWIGTTNGIFVQSPSGETQEGRFTATNSPLFDNTISDIAINSKTGEVWIGTSSGLISLRGEATEGGKFNTPAPYAYPNPVRPDYDGPIAIYGLARDANVKITDVAGNLVYEGKSLGGQAIWNGRDYLGRRVASGVYLIFATSTETFENPDAVIAKVVILN